MFYRQNHRTEKDTKWLTVTLVGIYVLIASFLVVNRQKEGQGGIQKPSTDNNNFVITSK